MKAAYVRPARRKSAAPRKKKYTEYETPDEEKKKDKRRAKSSTVRYIFPCGVSVNCWEGFSNWSRFCRKHERA